MSDAATPEDLGYIDYAAYRQAGGYGLFEACLSGRQQRTEVLRALSTVATTPLLVGTADAGAHGRLVHDPHRLLEGLLVACWAMGIDEAGIELRADEAACSELLGYEIETLRLELPVAGLPPIRLLALPEGVAPRPGFDALFGLRQRFGA